jgi:hypothetical protein
VSLFVPQKVSGAELTFRSLAIGTSTSGAATNYRFNFNTTTAATIGSIVFEVCSNSPLFDVACTAPTGFNASSTSLTSQSGVTGFTIDSSSDANTIILTRPAAFSGPAASQYQFSSITNPTSATGASYYVRLSTHASTDGSGARIDDGAVVLSINPGLGAAAYVPPFLIMCVGVTVASDCSTSTGSYVSMGELSTVTAKTSTTQFALATNDYLGHVVYVTGTTMTSGNDVIPALSTQTASNPGTSQFGINLRSNSNPSAGTNVSGPGTGVPTSNYNTSNQFRFVSGDAIAQSTRSTDFDRFTVTYMTNISSSQAAGTYAATFTYIGVVQF